MVSNLFLVDPLQASIHSIKTPRAKRIEEG